MQLTVNLLNQKLQKSRVESSNKTNQFLKADCGNLSTNSTNETSESKHRKLAPPLHRDTLVGKMAWTDKT